MAELPQGKSKETDSDLLRLLVDSVIDYAIFILDVDGRVISWNRGAERIKGYKAEEIVGRHFSTFYPQEVIDRGWPEHELKVAAVEGRFEDEGWRLRKDGSRFWANVIITALRDEKGELQGFSKVTRDLTERKEAEEALRRSEERFRLIVESAKDYAIFLLDPQGNVASWNPGAERIKGYTASEIIGRHFSTFYPHEALDRGWPAYELKVAAAAGRFEDEGWRVRKDGSQFWANVIITAIEDDHGNLLGFSKITRDLTARKQAEENARRLAEESAARQVAYQERERLRVTLASIGDAVISTDARGRVEFLNTMAEDLTGWKSGDAVGRALEDVFHIVNEGTRQPVENPAVRALREGKVVGLANHTVLISKSGTERPIDDSAAPIKDANGELIGSVLVFRDITERRHAERDLQLSEARKSAILETALDCNITMDHEGTVIEFNRACERTFGYSRDQVIGQELANFIIPPSLRQKYRQGMVHYLETGEGPVLGKRHEMPALRSDGSEFPVELSVARISSEGAPLFTAYLRDITQQKQAERELAEAHKFLSSSLDALSSHIAVLDENGVVLAVNDAWRRFADENQFTGHNYGVGTNYIESCEPNDDECFDSSMIAGLKDVLAGGASLFEFEYPCHSPTEQRWFVMRATRFKSPGPVRVVVAHEDVTKRKLAEDKLKDADRRKDEFLATLAHELRNPLAPIRNGLEILRLVGSSGAMADEARTMMERQLTHMVRLVDDLLDVSRITRNKLELRKERVSLATVIHTAVETSRPLIEQSGHTLSVTLTSMPVYLDADPVRLAQVFSNLLTNAAKYTEPGGTIVLTAQELGDDALVRVKDNGLGIPVNALPCIFEMFSQVDSNMGRAQGGLGIGLTLVRRLTEMHGGSVQATSEGPGQGSEFTVRIPMLKESRPDSGSQTSGLGSSMRTHRRILVVDDNRDAAESLSAMLRLMGSEVRTAADGLAAIEVAELYRPEVILMDIGLPKLNGRDACRRIREQPWSRGMAIVALTGWGQEEDRRRSKEAGFDHHLVKPVDVDKLSKLLAQVKQ